MNWYMCQLISDINKSFRMNDLCYIKSGGLKDFLVFSPDKDRIICLWKKEYEQYVQILKNPSGKPLEALDSSLITFKYKILINKGIFRFLGTGTGL